MVSSSYLRLLIFLLEILIPACDSSSLAFLIMFSAYKLNQQGDNIQSWRIPFLIWNPSVVSCPVLTVASWPVYRFLKRQVMWSGIPISLKCLHMNITTLYEHQGYLSTYLKQKPGSHPQLFLLFFLLSFSHLPNHQNVKLFLPLLHIIHFIYCWYLNFGYHLLWHRLLPPFHP